jgi:hypothetical protein
MAESLDVRAGPNDTCSIRLLQSFRDASILRDRDRHCAELVLDEFQIPLVVLLRLL